jgi:hypothetical protein
MTIKDENAAPQAPIADKEPWEIPRVVAAAIEEVTTLGDDTIGPS